jgi:hypothetical protein
MANEMQSCNQAQQRGRRSQPSIGAPAAPERLAIGRAIRTAGWRKFMQRRDAIGTRRTSGTVEFVAKPQLSDIKPKVLPRVPLLFSAFGPYFSPNLRPILGVPVRRLWK